nr:SOS response-associated peptidase [Maliibacterium massiliense]
MCGRYNIEDEEANTVMRQIIDEASARLGAPIKTGEIFPTNIAPVLALDGGGLAALPMVWGFPHFSGKGVIINGKAETLLDKPMFRASALARRCAIPTTGFYEWKSMPGQRKKDKYIFRAPESPILYLAGVFNTCNRTDGVTLPRYVILTTEAAGAVAQVHNRMPVVLREEELRAWASDNDVMARVLARKGPDLVARRG